MTSFFDDMDLPDDLGSVEIAPVELLPPDVVNQVSPAMAEDLAISFAGFFGRAKAALETSRTITVTGEDQVQAMRLARDARLTLRQIRIEADKVRKALKEASLRKGKAIDGIANVLKYMIEPEEDRLEKAEKFRELAEAERKRQKYEQRKGMLEHLGVDPRSYRIDDMTDDQWTEVHAKEVRMAQERKAAEARMRQERIEREAREKEEAERIRSENERLRAEAEKAKAEAEKAKAEARASEDAARKAKEAAEAAQQQQIGSTRTREYILGFASVVEKTRIPIEPGISHNEGALELISEIEAKAKVFSNWLKAKEQQLCVLLKK